MNRLRGVYRTISLILVGCMLINTLLGCKRQENEYEQITNSNGSAFLNLISKEEGFYEISLDAINQAGLKINTNTLGDLILLQRGLPINYWVDNHDGDIYIRYFSPSSTSRYSQETVTVLTKGGNHLQDEVEGKMPDRIPEEFNADLNGVSGCFQEQIYEENVTYQPKAIPGEPWFWKTMMAPGEVEISIDLESGSTGNALVRFRLWALTEADVSPDHKIIIKINASKVGEYKWDGKGFYQFDSMVKQGVLAKGVNNLTIESPGINGIPADKVFLDWIKIYQPVTGENLGDQVKVRCQSDFDLPVKYLSNYDLYTNFPDGKIDRLFTSGGHDEVIHFEAGRYYWLLKTRNYQAPDNLTLVSSEELQIDSLQPADYLVIGDRDLLTAAITLINWRKSQGLSVTAVPADILYHYFNNGYAEPEAIRSFLFWTSIHWPSLPRYVLLLGDASYDPKGYQSEKINNLLPSFFIETQFGGETASDYGYSIISNEPWVGTSQSKDSPPRISVGRLPVCTPEQLNIITEKIIAYENYYKTQENLGSKILVIADSKEISFQLEGENFLKVIPPDNQSELLETEIGVRYSDDKVIQVWREGYEWIVYFGHGSIHEWGSAQYLASDRVGQLPEQPNPPIILQFTCLSGLFTHPEVVSLSEYLLSKPRGGAIALLAPTSLTLPVDQHYLSQQIALEISSSDHLRLGDLLLGAWQELSEIPVEINDVTRTFVLLGDPGLLLP